MKSQANLKEFQGMGVNELEQKINELKKQLFTLRFQLATGQLTNHNQIKAVRRDIARAETVLTQVKAQKNNA